MYPFIISKNKRIVTGSAIYRNAFNILDIIYPLKISSQFRIKISINFITNVKLYLLSLVTNKELSSLFHLLTRVDSPSSLTLSTMSNMATMLLAANPITYSSPLLPCSSNVRVLLIRSIPRL